MTSKLINKLLIGVFALSLLNLCSCFNNKEIKVDTIYDIKSSSFNISSNKIEEASKACVQGIDSASDRRYSGVIFYAKDSTYYVAMPYFEGLQYDNIILYDSTSINPTFVGSDQSNKVCVYSFETSVDINVIQGSNDEIYKTKMIASISSPCDTNSLTTYKQGLISSTNSSYFTTDILLSEPDVGALLINENAEMVGYVFSYTYLSEGTTPTETYSNYVKGLNQAYRYTDFYKYVINIVENGTFVKGLMGITQTNNEYAKLMASQYNLNYIEPENAKGLSYIINVSGSAEKAGVKAGEFIYSVNDILVYRTLDVSHIMSFLAKGTIVELKTIDSNGLKKVYSIILS